MFLQQTKGPQYVVLVIRASYGSLKIGNNSVPEAKDFDRVMVELARRAILSDEFRNVTVATYCPATPNASYMFRVQTVLSVGLNDLLVVRFLFGVVGVLALSGFRSPEELEIKFLLKLIQSRTPILTMSDGGFDVKHLLGD